MTAIAPSGVSPAAIRHVFFASLAAWRYAGGKRDLRIDFLRGFAVLAMVADHLGGDPSWLYSLTGGNRFLFSAAEGFVFISGLVMGIVYAGLIARRGLGPALSKTLRRAASLYALTILLTFGFMGLSFAMHSPWVVDVQVGDRMAHLAEALTLHRTFYLTDVLLLYTLLVAITLLAFILIVNKRTPVLLAVPWAIEDNSVFHLAT